MNFLVVSFSSPVPLPPLTNLSNSLTAHYDDDSIDPLTGYKSEYTLLIYLTGKEDGVLGGETAFYPSGLPRNGTSKGIPKDSVIAPLERGSALLHRHGRDCLIHEGLKVEKGDKWVLRSDVMFG